jgi:hypothetical protein
MKLWKKILIGLGAVIALLIVVGLLLPSKWRVERSMTMAAKPESIVPLISDLKRWKDWAAWNNEMDPTMQTTYNGPPSGPGASMSWKGDKMGFGTLTLTEVDVQKGIKYEMKMEEQQTPAHGSFSFAPEGTGTKVTWVDEGDMGWFIPGRYFIPMLEKQLGEHFEIGLSKLKALAEAAPAERTAER